MKIRNIFKQNFLPFSLGLLLASLIFTAINTYDTKMKLKQIKNIQEKQDRYHQERLEWQDRYHQEVMKELKRKKGLIQR